MEAWPADVVELLSGVDVVAVDAPLSLPREGAFRDFERELLGRGFRLLPLNMRSMRKLAELGERFRVMLSARGVTVLETHPATVRRVMGVSGMELVSLMSKYGYCSGPPKSDDEVDALTCLSVAVLYVRGEVEVVRGEEGSMILPLPGSLP